ncbi:hypothetical protein B0T13DRAFT_443316 [Neurospora crassa]|nr:hypothetical protein B0T13DRAFT_443316 [Neurospora crassa]
MFPSSSNISSSSDANPSQSSSTLFVLYAITAIILFQSSARATAAPGSTPVARRGPRWQRHNVEDDEEKEKEEEQMGGERKRERMMMERTTYVSRFKYVTSDVVDEGEQRGGTDFYDTQDEDGVDDVEEEGEDADVGNTDDSDIVDYAGNESEMKEEFSDEVFMALLKTMRGGKEDVRYEG